MDEAYDWLRKNTSPETRVLAYEDIRQYLFTGHQAMRPACFTPTGLYVPHAFDEEASFLLLPTRVIGARYWLTSDDDFTAGALPMRVALQRRVAELKAHLPLLFCSSGNHVQIYDLDCLQHRNQKGCPSVADVLMPQNQLTEP